MKKILQLLEQKIQWVVFGMGVLYVLFMAWTYVIQTPVKVTLDGLDLTPGEIDKSIWDGPGSNLSRSISEKSVRQPATAPSYVADFKASMSYSGQPAEPWRDMVVILPRTPMFKVEIGPKAGPVGPEGQKAVVENLPNIPAPKLTFTSKGLTTIQPPGQPNNVALVAANGNDKSWVSVRFEIDPAAIAAAFDQAKIPQPQAETVFVQVKLERQDMNPNGTWGDPVVVAPLGLITILPLPSPGAARNDFGPYLQWATNHQADILQPQFYTRVKGDDWNVPGPAVPNAAAAPATRTAFDAAKWLQDHPNATDSDKIKLLTPDQRRLVAAEEAKAKTPRGNPRGAAPRPSPEGGGRSAPPAAPGGGVPGVDFAPNDLDRPATISYQVAEEENPAPPEAAAPVAAAPQRVTSFPLPTGLFDPHKWAQANPGNPLIVGWAHDDTVVPGHSYRYRVSYKLKNPVFFAPALVKDPKFADVFALESQPSVWSEKIDVQSTLSFYIVKTKGTPSTAVTFAVFRLQQGQTLMKIYDVSAGDGIGAKETNADFTTGSSMVDLREDQRTGELYALLMDAAGELHRRDVNADSKDPMYLKLKDQAGGAAPAKPADPVAGAH